MGTTDRPARFAPSRRAVLAAGLGALVVASVPLARRPRRRRFARTAPSMGTVAEVLVVDEDGARAQRAIDVALAELARVEGLMTRYDARSDVGRANRAGRGVAVRVSSETAEVVEDALRWAEASEGEFDPCLERAIALWDVGERRAPPPAAEVARLAGRGLYRGVDVVVDPTGAGGTIRFDEADAALDLGGIAKGHAVDRAAAALARLGVRDAVVNVGGDLVALGHSENGDPWRVGIRSAGDPEGLDGQLEVSDLAVATSGDYERYFDHEGRRYHHILDASTASPRRCAAHSVTVLASTCREADAAATTVFGRPAAWADRVLRTRAPGARIVATA